MNKKTDLIAMKVSKLAILLLLVVCVTNACVTQTAEIEKTENFGGDAKSTPTILQNTPETYVGALETPTPFTRQEVIFKGENAKINIEQDFRISINNQKHPKIWFEYEDKNGNIVKKEISDETKNAIKNTWKSRLTYLYAENISESGNEKYDASFENTMEGVSASNKLEQLEVNLFDNRKKFTDNEINNLLVLQGKLAFERFDELSKHFDE